MTAAVPTAATSATGLAPGAATGLFGALNGAQGHGPAGGFEALLAAFFGRQGEGLGLGVGDGGQASLQGKAAHALKSDNKAGHTTVDDALTTAPADGAALDTDPLDATAPDDTLAAGLSPEAQALAALFAAPLQKTPQVEETTAAAPSDGKAQPPAVANGGGLPGGLAAQTGDGKIADPEAADPKVPPSDANGKAKAVDFAQALAATRQGARSDAIKEERAAQVGYKPPPAAPSTVDARPETVDPVQPPVEAEVAAAELPAPAPLSGKDRAHLRAGRTESGRKGETPTSLVGVASPDLADKPAAPSLAALAVKPDQVEAADGADSASSEPKTEFVAANTDIPDDTIAAQAAPVSAHATPASAQAAAAAARGAPETVASLAAQIVKKLEGRTTRFDVQLHPADLGRVDVRLEIGAHGRLMASMSFENPHAAAELRGRADELRSALESAGFDLSGGLSFDVAGDRGQGQRQTQDNTPDGGGALRGRAFEAALATADETASAALAGALNAYQSRVAPGLDIRI